EAEAGGNFIHQRKYLLDLDTPDRILARSVGDFDVEYDHALVHHPVVLDVADERGRQQVAVAREEYARPGYAQRALDEPGEVLARHRHLRERGAQLEPAAAPGPEHEVQDCAERQWNPPARLELGEIA